ncbi:MAG: SulP family inorganic anion transporter [Actinomycetota bacterium]|nr:SulP family inorganic anion transporter [Actinomycetota bacterium]MDH4352544.1 SulP family inorganic anion transporter [Actinomycetota bacterium]MDH5277643.1 SulP family inorganic anion transporter [Actinomycetota bacterium]
MSNPVRATASQPTLTRLFPVLGWLPKYQKGWLRPDLIAGLTVAALVVPKSLGYAGIAGVPLQYGLYAAAAGATLYAVMGTCRQIATGPSSALAAVAAGAVAGAGSSEGDALTMVASITLVSGLGFVVLAVFRMGWISQFLSKAVITGFLFGAGIQVAVNELASVTGTTADGSSSWDAFGSWFDGLRDTNAATLVVGLVSLVVIFGLRFAAPRVPGALVLVVGGLIASAVFDLSDRGVALVGDVPHGLPSAVLPDLDYITTNLSTITTASLALLLIGFSQTAGDARAFASKHRYQVDINQESLAQGVANAGSGLIQGIPVSASLSSSSLNDQSGAKTQLASLTTGALAFLTLLFLAPLFSDLPKPVLGALIIEAVVMGMMDVKGMRRLFRVKRADFWIAVAALVGVLSAGVLTGVLIGIALSMVWLVYVSSVPQMPVMGKAPDEEVFRSTVAYPDSQTFPGLVALGIDGGLFFVDADALEDRVRELAQQGDQPLRVLVLDFEGVNYIDSQGSGTVANLVDLAQTHHVALRLARLKPYVFEVLSRDGVIDRMGRENVHDTVYGAAQDFIES